MRKNHSYKLRVFEQPHKLPTTFEQAEENKTPKELDLDPSQSTVKGRNVDDCLKNTREFIEKKLKRVVRTVSIGPEGIFAVVYREDVQKDPKSMSEKRRLGIMERRAK